MKMIREAGIPKILRKEKAALLGSGITGITISHFIRKMSHWHSCFYAKKTNLLYSITIPRPRKQINIKMEFISNMKMVMTSKFRWRLNARLRGKTSTEEDTPNITQPTARPRVQFQSKLRQQRAAFDTWQYRLRVSRLDKPARLSFSCSLDLLLISIKQI